MSHLRRLPGLLGVGLLVAAAPTAPTHAGEARRAPVERPAGAQSAAPVPGSPGPGHCVHAVRPGDTVSRLAARYGVPSREVILANGLTRPDALRPGHRLRLPGCFDPSRRGGPVAQGGVLGRPVVVVPVGSRRVATRLHLARPDSGRAAPEFIWPVQGPTVSGFGRRRGGWHAGIDLRAAPGTPVLAAAGGVVVASRRERAYGWVVRISHDDGFVTTYAHNLENLVEVGDRVAAGYTIARVGRTGRSTGHHLHFEIRREGTAYDPLHLLPARAASVLVARAAEEPPGPDD